MLHQCDEEISCAIDSRHIPRIEVTPVDRGIHVEDDEVPEEAGMYKYWKRSEATWNIYVILYNDYWSLIALVNNTKRLNHFTTYSISTDQKVLVRLKRCQRIIKETRRRDGCILKWRHHVGVVATCCKTSDNHTKKLVYLRFLSAQTIGFVQNLNYAFKNNNTGFPKKNKHCNQ